MGSFLFSFAQDTAEYHYFFLENLKPEHSAIYTLKQDSDSGWIRKDFYIENAKLQMMGLYEDSSWKLPNGTFYFFYKDGSLFWTGKYVHGYKEGIWLSYHPNRMPADSICFRHGHPIGTFLQWYNNGILSDSLVMDQEGNGIEFKWHYNGVISSAGYLTDWILKKGIWQYFHDNGKLSQRETFENGNPVKAESFDENGDLLDSCLQNQGPIFQAGIKDWFKYVYRAFFYTSNDPFPNPNEYELYFTYGVDENGMVRNAFVEYPLHDDLDKRLVNAVSKSPKWKPAISHNRRIYSRIFEPFSYNVSYPNNQLK
jgi:antitoxin component YwqK of YwqJK toxin-antitoxin module